LLTKAVSVDKEVATNSSTLHTFNFGYYLRKKQEEVYHEQMSIYKRIILSPLSINIFINL